MASLRSGKVKANDGGFIGIREAERNLGNPASSGYILSSNTSGVRSWIDPTTGIIVEDEGSQIATGATLINFVGSNVTAVASGTAVTVTFTPSSGGGGSAIASTITVSDESTDTENFIVFVNGATGNQEPKTGTNLTFNSSTGIITAGGFSTSGGTSTQFLKADGSIDSSTYLTSYTETNDLSSSVTWANVPDGNITQGSVTQHESALTITESQISDLGSYLTAETNDLSSSVTWVNVPDANITETSVTQHESALTITESQISDFGSYLTTETQTLDNVVGLGSTTTQTISVGSLKVSNYFYDQNGSAGTADYVLTSNGPSSPWSWTAVADVSGGILDAIVVRQDGSNVGSGGTNTTLDFYTNFTVTQPSAGIASVSLKDTLTIGALTATGIVTAAGFSTSNGTSTQFLKADGSIDSSTYLTSYTETNDLSSSVTWANVPDGNITQSSVTQHESALTITESQISDLGSYLTSYTETQTLNDVLSLGNTSSTGLSVGVVTATSLKGFDHLQAPHGSTVNYSVTVASKTAAHRYNGTGSGSGYVIDGVESPFLTLTPGRTYRFTLSSGDMSSHPFRFYLRADRSGGTYTTNVTSTSTYTEIIVTDETPTVLHYQCSSHAYMGNAVQVNSNKVNTPYLIEGLNGANVTGVVTATGFSTSGGTSSQFLKADGSIDSSTYLTSYTETNDLSSAVTWANVPDTNITESSVTQHESALTITESQISDLGSYLTSYTETQTLNDVVGLGSTTTQTISVGNLNVTGTGNTSTITGAANLVLDPSAIGDATGKVTILGDLQVDGTQTIINSTTLEVDDKLVSIAKSATNATEANGAGLEINGASATFTYASTGDKWVANKSIEATSFIKSSNSGGFLLADGTEDTNTYLTPTGDGSSLTGVGLDYFEEAQRTTSPNNVDYLSSLTGIGATDNIDVAIVPKGTGAILGNISDGAATGGNKRGDYAVDLQLKRTNASEVASADYSFIGGGKDNTIASSGDYAVIVGGSDNTINAASNNAVIVGGSDNDVSSLTYYGAVFGGLYNEVDGDYGTVIGGASGTTKGIHGIFVVPASENPYNSLTLGTGAVQATILNLAKQTTDATSTALSSNSNSAGSTNQLVLLNNSAVAFKGTCIAGVTGAGNTKAWEFRGAIKRGANAASTTLVGSVIKDVLAYDSGAAAWDVDFTADTTNGALKVTVTGQAGTTIRWTCKIETTELAF